MCGIEQTSQHLDGNSLFKFSASQRSNAVWLCSRQLEAYQTHTFLGKTYITYISFLNMDFMSGGQQGTTSTTFLTITHYMLV